MDRNAFWTIVEQARNEDPEQPEESLREILQQLPQESIAAFQKHFDQLFVEAYRWDLWGAAYLIGGGCSDDGFADFRYGLISAGRKIYEAAISNPDSLADVDIDLDNELYGYVATEVYEEKGDGEMPRTHDDRPEPLGEEWDFDDESENQARLPRLSKKY